jgi:hypothetical protein
MKGFFNKLVTVIAVSSIFTTTISSHRVYAQEVTAYATNTAPDYFDDTTKEPLSERVRFFTIHEFLTGYFFRRLEDKGECGGRLCEEQGIGETLAMSLALAGENQDTPQYTLELAKVCIIVNNPQCVEQSLNDALALIDSYEPTPDLTSVPSEPIDLNSVTSAFGIVQYAGSSLEKEPWNAVRVYSEMLNAGTEIPHFKIDRAIAALESLRYTETLSVDGVSLKELAKQDISAVLQRGL